MPAPPSLGASVAGQALRLLHASTYRKVQEGVQHQPPVQLDAAELLVMQVQCDWRAKRCGAAVRLTLRHGWRADACCAARSHLLTACSH